MAMWRWMRELVSMREGAGPGARPRKPCKFSGRLQLEKLESRELLATDMVVAMPSPGAYRLGVEGDMMRLQDAAGIAVWEAASTEVSTLTVLGTGGDDTLIVAETAAGLPQFAGDLAQSTGFASASFVASGRVNAHGTSAVGLHFEAFTGENTLVVALQAEHDVAYFVDSVDATGGKRGNVNIQHELTLSFAGLTPQIIPGLGGTLTIDLSNSPDNTTIRLADDPGNLAGPGGNLVAGNGGFETTFFAGFTALQITGGPATNHFLVESIDPASSLTKITLEASDTAGATFEIKHLATSVDLQVVGGIKDDVLLVEQTTAALNTQKIEFQGGGSGAGDRVRLIGNGLSTAHFTPNTLLGTDATVQFGVEEIVMHDVRIAEISQFGEIIYESRNPEDVASIVDGLSLTGQAGLSVVGNSLNDVALLALNTSLLTIDLSVNDTDVTSDVVSINNTQDGHNVDSAAVLTGAGTDSIRIHALSSSLALGIDTGSANDEVTIGNELLQMEFVRGSIALNGGDNTAGDTNTVVIEAAGGSVSGTFTTADVLSFVDVGHTATTAYEFDATRMTRNQGQETNFIGFERVMLATTAGNADINIDDTAPFSSLILTSQNGNDDIIIDSTGTDSIVVLIPGSGADEFTVRGTGTRSLMVITDADGRDSLDVQSTGSNSGLLWTGGGGNDSVAIVQTGDGTVLNLDGGPGNDQLHATEIGNETRFELKGAEGDDNLTVVGLTGTSVGLMSGGDGNDTLNVGSSDPNGMDGIQGSLTIDGGNNELQPTSTTTLSVLNDLRTLTLPVGDRLIAIDDGHSNAISYGLNASSWTRSGANTFSFANIESFDLLAAIDVATITVSATPPSTITSIVSQDASDQVQVNNTGDNSVLQLTTAAGADLVTIANSGANGQIHVDMGDDNDSFMSSGLGTNLALQVDGGNADDNLAIAAGSNNTLFLLQGSDGNDTLTYGSPATRITGILDGTAGDDTLIVATLAIGARLEARGGSDNDSLNITHDPSAGILGTLVLDGEAGIDRLLIDDRSANGDYVYVIDQSSVQRTTLPVADAPYRAIELVELQSGTGADQINILPSDTVAFVVHGNDPIGNPGAMPGDRLDVEVTGLTGVSIPTGVTAGTITANGILPVTFDGIEQVGDSVMDDRFEVNNDIANASLLAPQASLLLADLTLPTDDRDYFFYTPIHTGYTTVRATPDANSAPITLQFRDTSDNLLATVSAGITDTFMVLPTIGSDEYTIVVLSEGLVFNYALEFTNTPVPAPIVLGLTTESDTGILNDNTTNIANPSITLEVDLTAAVALGIPLLSPTDAVARTTPGMALQVLVNNTFVGYATHLFDSTWNIQLPILAEGIQSVTAAVDVVDPHQPRRIGSGPLADPVAITIDHTPPTLNAPVVVPGNDSGFRNDDRVTNLNQLVFAGNAEIGSSVVVRATNVDTGVERSVGTVTTDATGAWQLTTDVLPDAQYQFSFTAIDLAGNTITSPVTTTAWIDTQTPDGPVLDLVSDNGDNTNDNRTSTSRPTISIAIADPTTSNDRTANDMSYKIFLRSTTGTPATRTLVVDSLMATGGLLVNGVYTHTLSLGLNTDTGPRLMSGTYELTTEVLDRAGNLSQGEALTIVIEGDDTPPPITTAPDLLSVNDTGMRSDDNVTQLRELTFIGTNESESTVSLFVQPRDNAGNPTGPATAVATGTIGDDASDGNLGNDLGAWRLTTIPLADGRYTVYTVVVDDGLNSTQTDALTVWIDTSTPATPFLDLLSDSGRSASDNITNFTRPTFSITPSTTAAGGLNAFPNDVKYRLYLRPEGTANVGELLIVDSFAALADFTSGNFFTHSVSQSLNSSAGAALPDGVHNFRLEIEDRAGNVSPSFLLDVEVDTALPSVTFGVAGTELDGLHPTSDTGVVADIASLEDRLTSDVTPTLWGASEANAHVSLYLLVDDNNTPSNPADDTLRHLGDAIASPLDGTTPNPRVDWQITSSLSLNDTALGLLADGNRRLVVVADDVAGNRSTRDTLAIFVDTVPPVVQSITYANDRDVFQRKVSDGPSPLPTELWITFSDDGTLEERQLTTPAFPSAAVSPSLALIAGNYQVVGDATGVQTIVTATRVAQGVSADGQSRIYTVALQFAAPLPDDRFTVTIVDSIADPAGNRLDGDSRPTSPGTGNLLLPSGDGVPGGTFTGRFTVDARPEIGTWAGGSVALDINGNWTFDPANADQENRDLQFSLGFTSDDLFAGRFTVSRDAISDRYDKLAAYGDISQSYGQREFRWLIDLNNDGAIRLADGDLVIADPANINGLPVAGNFDGLAFNGDEVGLFTGTTWWLDTDHDFRVDLAIPSQLRGLPVVGDFDGNGVDDLGTYFEQTNQFQINFGNTGTPTWNGDVDLAFRFGFLGVRERPAAADFDQDGIDDLVLWSPDRSTSIPRTAAEWYLLISDGISISDRIQPSPDPRGAEIRFAPIPLGNDGFALFGDDFALPIVGNFDPPNLVDSAPAQLAIDVRNAFFNYQMTGDVNDDGHVSPLDAVLVINQLDATGGGRLRSLDRAAIIGQYWDTNNDGALSPMDALIVINALDTAATENVQNSPRASLSSGAVTAELLRPTRTTEPASVTDLALQTIDFSPPFPASGQLPAFFRRSRVAPVTMDRRARVGGETPIPQSTYQTIDTVWAEASR